MAEVDEDRMLFENEDHHTAFLQVMQSMYNSKQLVDVTLCVEDEEFACHRNVLAAISPFFRAMFTSALTESRQEMVRLHEVDPVSVNLLIDYAYTGKLEIDKNNVQNLLAAASLFQVIPVHSACAKFMETQLDISNCIGIYYFATVHDCLDLKVKAREHVEKNFIEVSHGEEFLALTADKMAGLLTSNELNVEKEETVYEALVRWVCFDEENRISHLKTLLPFIRFGLLDSHFIREHIKNSPIISKIDNYQQLLASVMDVDVLDAYNKDLKYSFTLRSGMIKPEHCLLLIGGVDQGRPSVNCYNPLTREVYSMADLIQEAEKVGYYDVEYPACVVTDDNHIYVAGGSYIYHEKNGESPSEDSFDEYEEETVRKDFFQYDNDHNAWLTRSPMLFPKSNFALAYIDNKIYCFGGLTLNQHPTEIIECFDIAMNRWSYVGMMPTTLVDLSAVVHAGLIYVLGGRTGVGAHNVVMSFDPKRREWTPLAGMPTPRFNFGACVIDGEIYVAGGQIYSYTNHTINRESLHSVEIYDIERNQWRQGPNLPENVYNVGLALIEGCLYACGTTEYQRSAYRINRYNVVYRFDLTRTSWEQMESDLCDIRDFACVAAKMHTRKISRVFRPEVDT